MALVLIVVAMILQFQMKGCVGCVESERMGLLELKSYLNSLDGLGEGSILESWSDDDPKSDCCKWERVTCSDAIGGHIVNLSLNALMFMDPPRGLNISLLHSFPQLKTFAFADNKFDRLFDPIYGYKSFQRLENLETLDFSGNYFNTSVLSFLSAARSLRFLNLSSNSLEGVFPPNGFNNFRELEGLDLRNNLIKDLEAGEGLREMKLKTLDLSWNRFSETARLKGLKHFVNLQVLKLAGNKFTLTPSIQALKDMPKLQELDLAAIIRRLRQPRLLKALRIDESSRAGFKEECFDKYA
ncbi:unnamed protein product [Microthlaspi erraticum]|uniref:Leucine-rich repeat-containing N-terminal plant-type domain-containing protein n=1 Tax=Microthlaspi erraticum TaxID=1685480 RepID=A0A6D2HGE3_9BRAS|nr:unnamed protein product [Microthlaspi erraticum]